MVSTEFASTFLKLGRAEEHLELYLGELRAWVNRKPYAISKKVDIEIGRHSVTLDIIHPPDGARWSLIAGDCIHNLRSALDHAVYALAIRDSGKNPPPKSGDIQFPIVSDPNKWEGAKKRRIDCLGLSSQTTIERLQPYNRRHQYLPPLLALLSYFDNADKHRLLNVTSWHTTGGNVRIQCAGPNPKIHTLRSPIDSGTEAIMSFETDDPNVSYDYDPSFEITVSHPQGPSGEHVSSLKYILEILVGEVKDVIRFLIR